ncbi:hypothetical protein BGZ74_008713 [Mortierella antarctica]|nr:hypothetical protein BGZ74_008713 [Mortierella antarctica]
MSTLPTFTFSCIAADNTGNPVLFGVASGRLEAHAIDLTNALAPTSKLISATSTPSGWDAQSSLGCYSYAGSAPSPSNPISILQFGATNNLQANFFPNGTWANAVETATASTLNYQSPKLFSLVGSTDGWNWFVARATPKAGGATSWKGVRAGARIDAGPQDLLPGSEPLFTVGAIAQDTTNFGNGFLFTFERSGSAGTAYRTTGNKHPDRNLTATESLLTLTKSNAVNMNSLVVTQDAIPLTSGFSAFVVDKSAASVSSKILVYGGVSSTGPSNDIHAFDIISGTWSGPALVNASEGDGAKNGLSPAVIGGAVAGVLVLLAIIGFLVYRRRRSGKLMPLKGGASSRTEDLDSKQAMINMMNMEDKSTNAPRLPRNSSSPGPPAREPTYKVETSTSSPSHSPAASNFEIALSSPTNAPRSHNRTQSSSSRTRRRKVSAAASPRMPSSESASQSVATLAPPSPGFNRSEYRDSGSYKVEYRDPGSSNSSTTAVASTVPTPTPRNRRNVPSPAASESDTNVFPLPPISGSGSRPSQGQSLAPISLQDLPPMPYKMNREQQQFWQERQMELLQDQRRQQQQQQQQWQQHVQVDERQADSQHQHQLKTPKLASLPRPVVRN